MSLLNRAELKRLIEVREEWCISIFMPTHRAGPEIQQDPVRLKNFLGEAKERLLESGLRRPDVDALLEPASALVHSHVFWRHQSDGLALFVSPKVFRPYHSDSTTSTMTGEPLSGKVASSIVTALLNSRLSVGPGAHHRPIWP